MTFLGGLVLIVGSSITVSRAAGSLHMNLTVALGHLAAASGCYSHDRCLWGDQKKTETYQEGAQTDHETAEVSAKTAQR